MLATLLYKIKNNLSAEIVNEIFPQYNQSHYLRSTTLKGETFANFGHFRESFSREMSKIQSNPRKADTSVKRTVTPGTDCFTVKLS